MSPGRKRQRRAGFWGPTLAREKQQEAASGSRPLLFLCQAVVSALVRETLGPCREVSGCESGVAVFVGLRGCV